MTPTVATEVRAKKGVKVVSVPYGAVARVASHSSDSLIAGPRMPTEVAKGSFIDNTHDFVGCLTELVLAVCSEMS
jgi:hypothetical protein